MTSPTDPLLPDTTSTSLILLVKKQDKAAWQRLVMLYSRLILYWCRRADVPSQDRRDILQDVFRAAFASIGTFSKTKKGDTFRGWLRSVTRSRIAEYYQTKNRFGFVQSEALDSLAARPDTEQDKKEESILVQRAREMILKKVDDKTRRAVELLLDGLTSTEVGKKLDMKPGAVRQAKRRVKAMLREFDGLLADTSAEEGGDSFEET